MNAGWFGVIGLGYVGLPLALELCRAGYRVVGVDADPQRVSQLQLGSSYIGDVSAADVGSAVAEGMFHPTTEYGALSEVEAMSICVPTPLRKSREPDVSYVVEAATQIASILQKGHTVILESTVYPGATEELVAPTLEEKSGLRAGDDFFLAYSPERIDPGHRKYHLADIPKLVGGVNHASTARAMSSYQRVFTTVLPLASAKEAEMAKLLENTFRAVNIGLVNELAIIAHQMGIDFWQVVDAAATKPFGFMPFYPGPGWGGHCIPVDPFYLSWKARASGLEAGFIEHAGVINNSMPTHVVNRVSSLLIDQRKCLRDARILLLGVAYKRDVADIRESPALEILSLLEHQGANLTYYDPYIPSFIHAGREWCCMPLDDSTLRHQDCVVIVTDHSCLDYGWVVRHSPLVFDTRNITRGVRNGHSHIEVL